MKENYTSCSICRTCIYRRKNYNAYNTKIGWLCKRCYDKYQKRMDGKELVIEKYRLCVKSRIIARLYTHFGYFLHNWHLIHKAAEFHIILYFIFIHGLFKKRIRRLFFYRCYIPLPN